MAILIHSKGPWKEHKYTSIVRSKNGNKRYVYDQIPGRIPDEDLDRFEETIDDIAQRLWEKVPKLKYLWSTPIVDLISDFRDSPNYPNNASTGGIRKLFEKKRGDK